jgi:N-carbamoylputrescine amidase
MKVTVCQLDPTTLDSEWAALSAHVTEQGSDFVLLPELSFAPWFAVEKEPPPNGWQVLVERHETWAARLPQLGVSTIAGTLPVLRGYRRLNMAFVWTETDGLQYTHAKTYLPNEPGYWEANWYERGPVDFTAHRIGDICLGFAICTELWFTEHARSYSKQGIHLLLNPRSTTPGGTGKWLAGGRTAGVIAGAYCLSSNHAGQSGDLILGGVGWVTDPDGRVLATTSDEQPFVTVEIDLLVAEAAKQTYPRYVDDAPI